MIVQRPGNNMHSNQSAGMVAGLELVKLTYLLMKTSKARAPRKKTSEARFGAGEIHVLINQLKVDGFITLEDPFGLKKCTVVHSKHLYHGVWTAVELQLSSVGYPDKGC